VARPQTRRRSAPAERARVQGKRGGHERASDRDATNEKRQADLYGNAPDSSEVALLLIDVINDLEFEGGDRLERHARPLARTLLELRERARQAKVPCIYANDNFGRWRSDFSAQVRHCLDDGVRGRALVEALQPNDDDYFVLKPKHSAFYQTCLELLLEHLGARTLIIGGISTDNCVSFTANDAYLRGYSLVILKDGTAAIDLKAHRDALAQMQRLLHAKTMNCREVTFEREVARSRARARRDR
jgi:nicotinamidase-related amidase